MATPTTLEPRYCVVCGAGSHRPDWLAAQGPVHCDTHSKEEVEQALAKLKAEQTPPPTAPPPSKPPLKTKSTED